MDIGGSSLVLPNDRGMPLWKRCSDFMISGWDYLTFLVIFIIGVAFLALVIFILGLPGRIAIARNHPDADAVNVMGWVGFLAVVPWIQAFIWAFKPTTVIDIRYLPEDERRETDAMIKRLKGEAPVPDADRPPDKSRPS